jgi:hypothetical protein
VLVPSDAARLAFVTQDVVPDEPFGVHDRALRVGDRDDPIAELVGELREPRAGVAESLDGDADLLTGPPA